MTLTQYICGNIIIHYRIISSTANSGWNNYYRRAGQRADPLQLESDHDYLIVGEFKDGGGGDYFQVCM